MRNISFLVQSKDIIASCEDVVERYKRVQKNLDISISPVELKVKENFDRIFIEDSGDVKICVIGHLNLNKGVKNVERFIEHLAQTKAPVKVIHIGKIFGRPIKESRNFKSYGGYEDTAHLNLILKKVNPNIFWFPSEVPETYCYALSEVLPYNIPISYFDIGAIGERLKDYSWKIPIKISTEPGEILDLIQGKLTEFRE
jgi:glycosyltransferase involved in cell wall biosynthesis